MSNSWQQKAVPITSRSHGVEDMGNPLARQDLVVHGAVLFFVFPYLS